MTTEPDFSFLDYSGEMNAGKRATYVLISRRMVSLGRYDEAVAITRYLAHSVGPPKTLEGQAFEEFFRANYETVRRRAYAAGLDLELAEDVTQEAMSIAARSWEHISELEHPVAYVVTIAINILRRIRRKEASLRAAIGQARPGEQERAAATGPEDTVVHRMDLERALHFVPAAQAECFVLHHMLGYLNREIAQMLGIPEGTVKSRVHAARETLREILGDDTLGGIQ